MRRLGLKRGCVAASAILLVSGAATAETVPAGDTSFRVSVHGVVLQRCGLTQSITSGSFQNAVSTDNTARADQLRLPFQIDCNGAFSVSLASRHGGLTAAGATSDPDFARSLAYSASVILPTGARTGACASTQMGQDGAGCRTRFAEHAGGAGVSGEGHVDVSLEAGDRPLLAGRYSDFLTVTLSPEVGGSGG